MKLEPIHSKFFLASLTALVLLGLCIEASATPVIIYPVCNHKEADGGDMGQHSNLCDADVFGNSEFSKNMYGDLIFDRTDNAETEKAKYITQLYAFVKASAAEFLTKKEKNPSKARIQRFADEIMSISYHESRLTHYAFGRDKRFKLMAADIRLVSRGLMQINQRFHASRDRDNSLDIYGNISLGMGLIYDNEQHIDASIDDGSLKCITKKQKASSAYLDLRLRSAWAAYNSGFDFCRFTRSNDKFSINDREFLADLNRGEWQHYVTDSTVQTKIDVNCLENGDEFCSLPEMTNSFMSSYPEKVIIYNDGTTCHTDAGPRNVNSTICADSLRLTECFGAKPTAVKFSTDTAFEKTSGVKFFSDREELCGLRVPGLIKVGEFLKLKKQINLYDDIDGKVVATLKPSEQIYQVIDYTVRGQSIGERFYKIASSRGHYGYINAGTTETYQNFVDKADGPGTATTLSIPIAGSKILIGTAGGLKVYTSPDIKSSVVGTLKNNSQFVAQSVLIKGNDNEMFIQVGPENNSGYVYVGRTYLTDTLNQYVRIE